MSGRKWFLLSEIGGVEPPSEFRVFRSGVNTTLKGPFLFDADAAAQLMAAYREHGVDVMLDWDHLSVTPGTPAKERRASGWCSIELRNGELWATNVRWTAEADAGIRAKEWRYISPYFATDDQRRPVLLLNIALTNVPATDRLDALIAASVAAFPTEKPMDLSKFAAALGLPATASEAEILDAISKLMADKSEDVAEAQAELAAAKEVQGELCSITGKRDARQALAVVAGLVENKSTAVTLSQRVNELESALRKRDFDAVVARGVAEGRIKPANKDRLVKKSGGDPVMLSAILEEIDPDPRLASATAQQPAPESASDAVSTGKRWSEMTPAEKHRLSNDNPTLARTLRAAG